MSNVKFLTVFLLVLFSCQSLEDKTDIIGKAYSFTYHPRNRSDINAVYSAKLQNEYNESATFINNTLAIVESSGHISEQVIKISNDTLFWGKNTFLIMESKGLLFLVTPSEAIELTLIP